MAVNLFNLTYLVAVKLGTVLEGIATGGSATTVIDLNDRLEADDYWNRGTVWILRDAAGAGASPEGKYSIVNDFVKATAVITLRDTVTDGVAAGDKYGVGKRRYPLHILIQKINDALRGMGQIPLTDFTLVSVAGQSEYSLPSPNMGLDLRDVAIQQIQDSDDNEWDSLYDWDLQKSPTGTADKIIIRSPIATGKTIRLTYMDYHGTLNIYTDRLNDNVHTDRVVIEAAELCLDWRKAKLGGGDPTVGEAADKMAAKAAEARRDHPIDAPSPTPHLFILGRGRGRRYPGDQNPR